MRLKLFLAVVLMALFTGAGAASAMKVVISVSKISQKMTVTVDGEKEYSWKVSTGAPGYDTPSGTYHP